jgi:putative phosphoesterase
MRIALISDIHGNNVALDAVLADISKQQVDSAVCLGDVATLGPQPVETLEGLKELNCVYIRGNHDSSLLQPEKALDYKVSEPLLPSLEWCLSKLGNSDFEFVRTFQPTLRVPLGEDDEMLCYHGSPKSNIDNIFSDTPLEEVDGLFSSCDAKVMAGGHTHIQMLRHHNGMMIVNPGSVGNAFLAPHRSEKQPTLMPWAEYAIVNRQDSQITVEFKRIFYNIDLLYQTIRKSDIPLKDWLLTQFKWPLN